MRLVLATIIAGLSGAFLYAVGAICLTGLLPATAASSNIPIANLGAVLGFTLGAILGTVFPPTFRCWRAGLLGAASAGLLVLATLPPLFSILFVHWQDLPVGNGHGVVQLLHQGGLVLGVCCYALPLLIIGPLAGCLLVPDEAFGPVDSQAVTMSIRSPLTRRAA